uniref:DUF4283 domain-containing protein n=1 Tax=Nicotiana tabacum TaxID=4097 RepID=A0A1S3YZ90_TOBAC|nr:PREDICTED: uncharacterized protein LOC107781456 [Nicotiana tabacum]
MAIDTNEEEDEKASEDPEGEFKVPVSGKDKLRIYYPWRFSIIIKLLGKKILHQVLKCKLIDLWKPTKAFSLINVGEQYYIVKFNKEENLENILQKEPWFVFGHFLSVQCSEPNFVPATAKQIFTAIWIRLPHLPTKFYDEEILKKVGNTVGRLLKADACTSAALRGRYARLCVELSLDKPVKSNVWIGTHQQQILYEGENLLYKSCGHLGHTARQCNIKIQSPATSSSKNSSVKKQSGQEQEHFPKKRKNGRQLSSTKKRRTLMLLTESHI